MARRTLVDRECFGGRLLARLEALEAHFADQNRHPSSWKHEVTTESFEVSKQRENANEDKVTLAAGIVVELCQAPED
eukprot:symbB.v1.2.011325.t2/scaffold757.1/size164899/6